MHLLWWQLSLWSLLLIAKLAGLCPLIRRRLIIKIKNTKKNCWNLIFLPPWSGAIALQVNQTSLNSPVQNLCGSSHILMTTLRELPAAFSRKVNDHIRQGYWCAVLWLEPPPASNPSSTPVRLPPLSLPFISISKYRWNEAFKCASTAVEVYSGSV